MAVDRRDFWDFLTLAFWVVFFAIGLAPELFFSALRHAAGVAPTTALVNSSAVITVGFSVYLASFAYRRCRAADITPYMAQGKALEVALVALVAFLELPAMNATVQVRRTLLALLLDLNGLHDRYLQAVIVFVSASKLLAWAYLFSLVVRYHAFGNRAVFTLVPSMFPSMNRTESAATADDAPAESETPGALTPPDDADAKTPVDASRGVPGK